MELTLEEIKEILYREYGIEEDDDYNAISGCYVGGKWLSIYEIIKAIEKNI